MRDDLQPGDVCWRVLSRDYERGPDGALYETVHRVLVQVVRVTAKRYVVRPVLRGFARGRVMVVVRNSLEP